MHFHLQLEWLPGPCIDVRKCHFHARFLNLTGIILIWYRSSRRKTLLEIFVHAEGLFCYEQQIRDHREHQPGNWLTTCRTKGKSASERTSAQTHPQIGSEEQRMVHPTYQRRLSSQNTEHLPFLFRSLIQRESIVATSHFPFFFPTFPTSRISIFQYFLSFPAQSAIDGEESHELSPSL